MVASLSRPQITAPIISGSWIRFGGVRNRCAIRYGHGDIGARSLHPGPVLLGKASALTAPGGTSAAGAKFEREIRLLIGGRSLSGTSFSSCSRTSRADDLSQFSSV